MNTKDIQSTHRALFSQTRQIDPYGMFLARLHSPIDCRTELAFRKPDQAKAENPELIFH